MTRFRVCCMSPELNHRAFMDSFRILENHPSRRSKSLHPVPLRYLDIVLCEFDTGTRAISAFRAYSGFMDPDVLDFYDQPVIRLLPAVTCGVNLCVSAGCSMVLVASVRSDRPSLRMPTEGQSPLVQKKAESVHVETDRNPLVFPFKTTQSLPFALRPADEPHFFCLKRRKPGCQR